MGVWGQYVVWECGVVVCGEGELWGVGVEGQSLIALSRVWRVAYIYCDLSALENGGSYILDERALGSLTHHDGSFFKQRSTQFDNRVAPQLTAPSADVT